MARKPLRPGDPAWLGDYRILARLGEGGMGTVYLGRDTAGRPVAVKAIRPELADREEFRARFRSEVTRVRQVPSFCTAAVLDADPDHRTPYLVVEYVDGPSLEEVVTEQGPLAAGDLHGVAVGVAAALTAIHGAGVIHRDLKPTNVLLSLGLPKVIDFGIARALELTSSHTRTDQVVGTLAYMAPERLDSTLGPVTPAADIFAWGAVVAYAGTGRNPFGGDTPMAAAARILTARPDLRGLPKPLHDVVSRALSKDPDGRPTANDLVQDLLSVEAPPPVVASVPPAARHRTAAGRFDARDLLEQLISEGPKPAVVEPPQGAVDLGRAPVRRWPVTAQASTTIRRAIYAMVAVTAATIVGATIASAQTSDKPKAQEPSVRVEPPVTTLQSKGPSFFEPLDAPGRFREAGDDFGRCRFNGGHLEIRAAGSSAYQCPAPADTFSGDQTIAVALSLTTPGSCALIGFRYRGDRGYLLTVCADHLELERLGGAILSSVGQAPLTALRRDTRHELAIEIAGGHSTVRLDGQTVLQGAVNDPGLAQGRIVLGVTNDDSKAGAEVRFADLDIRTG